VEARERGSGEEHDGWEGGEWGGQGGGGAGEEMIVVKEVFMGLCS